MLACRARSRRHLRATLAQGLACLMLVGCPTPRPEHSPAPVDKPTGTFFPIEKIVPADPSYFVVARSVTRVLEAIRAGVEPWRVVDRNLTTAWIDEQLRKQHGFSGLDLNDLDDAGFDLDGPVVLYSAGFEPTLALRVKDAARLTKFLKARTAKITTYVKSHRGQRLTSWKIDGSSRGTFLRLDDVFLLHVSIRRPTLGPAQRALLRSLTGAASQPGSKQRGAQRPWDLTWLDRILDRGQGKQPSLVSARTLGWLRAKAKEAHDVVAYLRPGVFNQTAREVFARGLDKKLKKRRCLRFDADLALIERVAVGIKLDRRKVKARLIVQLAKGGEAALSRAAASPIALPPKLWRAAALRLRVALDPAALKAWVEPPPPRRCGPMAELLRDARYVLRPFYRSPWVQHAKGRLGGVLLGADERGLSTLHLKGALVAGAAAEAAQRFFRGELTLKPVGAKPVKVEDRVVEQVVPRLTIAEAVQASFADDLFRLSVGDSMMERLLAGEATAATAGLLELRLEPGRIADLRAPLKLLEPGSTAASAPTARRHRRRRRRRRRGYGMFDRLAHLASHYRLLELRVAVAGNEATAVAGYELR